jgi:CRP-like cAMP-binding protein
MPLFTGLRHSCSSLKQHEELDAKLALLGDLFRYCEFPAGHTIFAQGDKSDGLYVIVRGQTNIVRTVAGSDVVVCSYRAGDWFGEMSLMFDVRRTATVRVAPDADTCVALRLQPYNFQQFLSLSPVIHASFQVMIAERTAERLSQIPLFQTVDGQQPWPELSRLAALFVMEEHAKDTVVITTGTAAEKFYLIVDGHVCAVGADGMPIVLSKDSWFGDAALLSPTATYTTTATCTVPCIFLVITAPQFHSYLPPTLRSSLATHLLSAAPSQMSPSSRNALSFVSPSVAAARAKSFDFTKTLDSASTAPIVVTVASTESAFSTPAMSLSSSAVATPSPYPPPSASATPFQSTSNAPTTGPAVPSPALAKIEADASKSSVSSTSATTAPASTPANPVSVASATSSPASSSIVAAAVVMASVVPDVVASVSTTTALPVVASSENGNASSSSAVDAPSAVAAEPAALIAQSNADTASTTSTTAAKKKKKKKKKKGKGAGATAPAANGVLAGNGEEAEGDEDEDEDIAV